MTDKSPSRTVSSTEFKNRLGHYLNEAMEGKSVVVSRRGRPVVTLEATQKSLPLMGLPEKQLREFHSLVDNLETEDLALVVQFVRRLLENKFTPQTGSDNK